MYAPTRDDSVCDEVGDFVLDIENERMSFQRDCEQQLQGRRSSASRYVLKAPGESMMMEYTTSAVYYATKAPPKATPTNNWDAWCIDAAPLLIEREALTFDLGAATGSPFLSACSDSSTLEVPDILQHMSSSASSSAAAAAACNPYGIVPLVHPSMPAPQLLSPVQRGSE